MNKSSLIQSWAEHKGVTKAAAERDLNEVFEFVYEKVVTALKSGEEAVVPGLVKFSAKERAERQGRNPKTGEALTIPAKTVVKATVANSLKNALA